MNLNALSRCSVGDTASVAFHPGRPVPVQLQVDSEVASDSQTSTSPSQFNYKFKLKSVELEAQLPVNDSPDDELEIQA